VARANLDRVRRQHDGGPVLPVHLVQGNWLDPLPARLRGTVGLVVSNPPYVAGSEWADLPGEVQREPVGALVAGEGTDGTPGLADVEAVLSQAWTVLARPGAVVIELAPHQADAATRMARVMGYDDVVVEMDLARRPRALVARKR
jgi:release factor glutamine methyltransferase